MMSSSNYSIGLQRLKPVHTAYGAICMPIRKPLMHWQVQVSSVSMVMVLHTTTHSTSSRATDISLVRDYNCNLSLQFRNTSFDILAFDSRERVRRIIRPALLKTRSLAAELAGTVKIFRLRGLRALNRLSFRTSGPRHAQKLPHQTSTVRDGHET